MTIGFGELRRGIAIEVDGHPYEVMEYTRHKMQQRAPVVKVKLRSILDGKVVERTFQSYTNTFTLANVEYRPAQYLYNDGQFYHFMNTETYDQYEMTREQLGDNVLYMKENLEMEIMFYNGRATGVRLPITVDLVVTNAPPGLKGDTAQGGTKLVTLETGLSLNVPLFITTGDVIKVDTRTGEYVERV